MNKKLKIAIYSGEIPSTTFIERLIIGLANSGCEILLFGRLKKKIRYKNNVLVKGYASGRLQKGVYLIYYTMLLLLFKPNEKRKLDLLLKTEARNGRYDRVKYYPVLWYRPDIFHIQWAKGLKDWVWIQEFGIKLVLGLRGAHINYSPIADESLASMYKENFPKVDAFHAVSKAIGKEAENYGASKEKIRVIYSGLPLANEKIAKKEPNKKFQVISIGRAHWVKGYTYALDACKMLKDFGFDFHYTIVGVTDDIEYAYQIHDLGLTDKVTLLDQLPYHKVQDLLHGADLLVLSSVKEGVANVVLEAMQNHTLVLTTNCGGMDEVIQDGINGFMVPIRDSKSLAEKILEVASLPVLEKELIRQNAFRTITENHNEHQMVAAMLALYKSI